MTARAACPRPGCPDRVPVPVALPAWYLDRVAARYAAGDRSANYCARPGCTDPGCLDVAVGSLNQLAARLGIGLLVEILPSGRLRLHPEPPRSA